MTTDGELPPTVVTASPVFPSLVIVPAAGVRSPRASVLVAGSPLRGLLSVEVFGNAYFQADGFTIIAALSGLPPDRAPAWWSTQDRIEVEVLARLSLDAGDTSLLLGQVDDVVIDYDARTLQITGRDLTAALIDAKTTEKYQNRTAWEIAGELAKKHDLAIKGDDTKAKVGTYYSGDHVQIADEVTEWNLLTYLAEKEGFEVYVRGRTLYFGKGENLRGPPMIYDGTGSIPQANVIALRLRRNLTLAGDVTVRVISWHSSRGTRIDVTRTAQKARQAQLAGGGNGPTYILRLPNLTEEQAIQRAEQALRETTQHERVVEAEMPGEVQLLPGMTVALRGTGTAWDQDYVVHEIIRRLDFDGGFTQRLRVMNYSPQTIRTGL